MPKKGNNILDSAAPAIGLGVCDWHNLPMRFLRALRELLQTWQGSVLSIVAALGAIYYGPKKMLETYDWYMDRFWDHKVTEFLRSNVKPPTLTAMGEIAAKAIPRSVGEISKALEWPEKRTLRSLKRLKRRHQVTADGEKWKAVL